MDHMTRATSFSGMVGRPKANTWYSLQNLTTVASAVPEIFQGVWNSKIGHLTHEHAHLGDSLSSEG